MLSNDKVKSNVSNKVWEAVSVLATAVGKQENSRLYCRNQSSLRMKPGGRGNRWARWGPLAYQAHQRDARSQSSQPGLKTQCWKE